MRVYASARDRVISWYKQARASLADRLVEHSPRYQAQKQLRENDETAHAFEIEGLEKELRALRRTYHDTTHGLIDQASKDRAKYDRRIANLKVGLARAVGLLRKTSHERTEREEIIGKEIKRRMSYIVQGFEQREDDFVRQWREELGEIEVVYGGMVQRRNDQIEATEKQLGYMQGALDRKEGHLAMFAGVLESVEELQRPSAILLNRELTPVYATKQFRETFGVDLRGVRSLTIPPTLCEIAQKTDTGYTTTVNYGGAEHEVNIQTRPIYRPESEEQIGTLLMIEPTGNKLMDWLRSMTPHKKRNELWDAITRAPERSKPATE